MGRYARRPPVAEHRLMVVGPDEVRLSARSRQGREPVEYSYPVEGFVERLGHHVPDHYSHNVRYFGLLAPRTKGKLQEYLFHLLGQRQPPRPPRLPWATALRKCFGVDPLVDSVGEPMRWIGRLSAQAKPMAP